ncbi:SpoVR-like protein [Chitinispirillum alkaliphilum]|nr:SpoVR-like protein [Chitinispirillum alkaliphilum]
MELVDQKTKSIMEGCKERAYDAGLSFDNQTLEYIVTNRDLIELTPKYMIPTLYDYWVHDVEVLKEKGRYELYPNNPYETVVNTRPAISFYNDNNPDWMNVMIFYHVLAHIDFFQNNYSFQNTWDYDFTGQALSDKRTISKLRSEKGHWVDYVIEFARSIDNMADYYSELSKFDGVTPGHRNNMLDYYFDIFLQKEKCVPMTEYVKEVERYNKCKKETTELGEQTFFADVNIKYPEFSSMFERYASNPRDEKLDLLQYIMEKSEFLNKHSNVWMKSVIEIVRKTSLFFQPQIRTKIMNEGWASYWHEKLFLSDDRIIGHESDFARLHAGIASMPRVGLNPYALGIRIFHYIEELGDTGKNTRAFDMLTGVKDRNKYDQKLNNGNELIFEVRKALSDYLFIENYIDQDFVNKHNLFIAGKRINQERMVWEYYVKSKKASDYKKMLQDQLYHPPSITVDAERHSNNILYLDHKFEGKPLVNEYISNVMLGLEYLWGGPVQLETSEVEKNNSGAGRFGRRPENEENRETQWQRVLYTMKDKKLSRKVLG